MTQVIMLIANVLLRLKLQNEINEVLRTDFHYQDENLQRLKISSSQSYNLHFGETERTNLLNVYPTLGICWFEGYLIKLEGDKKSYACLQQVTDTTFKKVGITKTTLFPLYDQDGNMCIDTMLDFKRYFEKKKDRFEMFFSDI